MAKTLRDLRIEAGLTLKQVSEALGCGITGPSSWELGKYSPHPRLIPKIAELYNITPQQAREAVEASQVEAHATPAGKE